MRLGSAELRQLPLGIVVLGVGHEGDELAHAAGQLLAQHGQQAGWGDLTLVLTHKLGDVDGLAIGDHGVGAVAEVAAILYAGGHDVDGLLMAKLLVGFEGDVEDAFAQAHERVLGTVCGLGEEGQRVAVAEHIDALAYDFLVLLHGGIAIADAVDGKHLEEGEHLLQEGAAEDVGTRHEDGGAVHRAEYHQGVEQRIGVVATDDDGPVLGQVFLASHDKAAQRQADDGVHP